MLCLTAVLNSLPSTLMVPMNASKSYAYHDVSLYSVWN
jgi:hypothetical protein